MPPPVIVRLRDLTRYRKKLVEARSSETQRIQKLLEDAGIELDSVVADVLGKSGRWARSRRLVLVDPIAKLRLVEPKVFRGEVLTRNVQASLYNRWCRDDAAHPHEAFVGLMALLHGASRAELANLRVDEVESAARTLRLGKRPYPVPIDPFTWTALERCLSYREARGDLNPHVLVTTRSAVRTTMASAGYLSHVLDLAGVSLQTLRSTRLSCMVMAADPKVVSRAFALDDASTVRYLGDAVDRSRLDAVKERGLASSRRGAGHPHQVGESGEGEQPAH